MKSILITIAILMSFSCTAQKATLDTTAIGIYLKDTKTNIVYEVFKDEKDRSYIIKDGNRMLIFRRERVKKTKPEPVTTKN